MLRLCHQEHRLDGVIQLPVHPDHLVLILEIGHGPQTAHNDRGAHVARAINQQILKRMGDDLAPALL